MADKKQNDLQFKDYDADGNLEYVAAPAAVSPKILKVTVEAPKPVPGQSPGPPPPTIHVVVTTRATAGG